MGKGDDLKLAAAIIANARDYAIFTMTAEGVIRSWSPGAEMVIGYAPQEAIGMPFEALFTDPDRSVGAPRTEIARTLAEGRAEDTRWHLRANGELFWANGVTMLMEQDGPPILLKVMRDETATRLAEDQRVLLLHELNHRIKNTLATVQSITDQTLRGAGVQVEVRQILTERLRAVSEAHNVLVDQNWAGADLEAIIDRSLAPFQRAFPERVVHSGPSVRLAPNQAVSVSLALHELATNAVKYGALSASEGQVRVTWNLALNGRGERALNMLWCEEGGPKVHRSSRRGFGTRLLERAFEQHGFGVAAIEMAESGVRCAMSLALNDEPGRPQVLDPAAPPPARSVG
jgi:PAS domain S-box-containing protein